MPSPVQQPAAGVQKNRVEPRSTQLRRSRHSARSLVAVAVMLLTSSIPARAQDGWGLLGLGTGSANITCHGGGCTSGRNLQGPTLLGTVGVMITPHLGVGVGLDQWWRSPADSEATNTGTVLLHYYPILRAGAFVEAGVGVSRAEVCLDGDITARSSLGPALMAAVGYDVHVITGKRGDLILTPRVSYVYSPIGDLRYYVHSPMGDLRYAAGRPPFATGWRHQVLAAGLGVGLWGRQ